MSGSDVINVNIFQSPIYKTIHGKADVILAKNIPKLILHTNVRHFGPTYSTTRIYIMAKHPSKANPTKNLQIANVQNPVEKIVKLPKILPIKLQPTKAGIRP